jgi:hypothetical protein
VRFARQHFQTDIAIAVFQEQGSGGMDEFLRARLAVAAARAAGAIGGGDDGRLVRHAPTVSQNKMKCNRFIS